MTKLTTTMMISKVLFGLLAVVNVSLMFCGEKWVWLNLLVIADWFTAALSSAGYMKRFVNKIDGNSIYEIRVPVISIGVLRMVQALLTLFFDGWTMSAPLFILAVIVDVIYAAFLMLDNSHYYFELGDEEDE